ncbi:ABC transporter ATP-binding protein [Desulfosporosinus youngiae]|uniref:ABC-type nitrate/sulfonate/bicarbonate transport system, ATPase component n=1 Tax=Desulfosporosinus youngiae DSM 17734 TaxID=768710 RepID=H5Y4P3_9FIRM|nr:ABC transporter ATP-binding protein [Desulfosporosinus youngiae]EHQ89779.1 ABC-type nitrate/sulfonate/bicarbonate transport system, ATPase component [Desulfosporosinus youngiae DSM 17734]
MSYAINEVSKNFNQLEVLKDFNMEIVEHKVTCILGPSGCGKTTLLNLLSGILESDSGSISGFQSKTISYLFQEPRLLSWKTTAQNVEYILKDCMSAPERKAIVEKVLTMVQLWEYKDYYTDKISGGMQQRLAIARAFAYPAEILLMDEPFKSLDLEIKLSLFRCFHDLWKLDQRTVVLVTHDIHDALILGDEIYILSKKPTTVREKIINNVPHKCRNLKDKQTLLLEERLYGMLA